MGQSLSTVITFCLTTDLLISKDWRHTIWVYLYFSWHNNITVIICGIVFVTKFWPVHIPPPIPIQLWSQRNRVKHCNIKIENIMNACKNTCLLALFTETTENKWQHNDNEHPRCPNTGFKFYPPLKGNRAPLRNGWFQFCGRESTRWA